MKYSIMPTDAELMDVGAVAQILEEIDKDPINRQRKDDSYTLDEYYNDRQLKYLLNEHYELFRQTWRQKRRITMNLVKKIADSIAVTYKGNVRREMSGRAARYDYFFDGMNATMSTLDRLLFTDQHVLLGIEWSAARDAPVFRAYPQYLTDFFLDSAKEQLRMVTVSDYMNPFHFYNGGRQTRLIDRERRRIYVYTDENFWIFDGDYRVIEQEDNPDNLNPFGMIPFIHCHMRDINFEDILDPVDALYNSNQEMNIMLSNLLQLGFKQSHAQLFIKMRQEELSTVGVDDNALGQPGQNQDMDMVTVGPEVALAVPGIEDAKYLEIPHNARELINSIVFVLNTVSGSYGLEDGTFSIEGDQYSSGIKMVIKKDVLSKMRNERKSYFTELENAAFKMMRSVAEQFSNARIPEEALTFEIVDKPAKIETAEQLTQSVTLLHQSQIINRVEAIMNLHPDFTRKEAVELVETMLEEDAELAEKFGTGEQDGDEQGDVGGVRGDGSDAGSQENGGGDESSVPGQAAPRSQSRA